jgi:hypothetical protein
MDDAKRKKIKTVIVLDFDGIICKNFNEMTSLSAEILEHHFARYGIFGEEVKNIAYDLYYKGYDLHEFLQKRNSDITKKEIDKALNDFYGRAQKEVYDKCPISGSIVSLMKQLYIDFRNTIYISSLTSERIIKDFLVRHGIDQYVEKIYGHESGRKDVHFKEIKKYHPKAKIVFITDGVHDAIQPANTIIGIVEDKNKERIKLFQENSGKEKECHILSKNFQILTVLQKMQILKYQELV